MASTVAGISGIVPFPSTSSSPKPSDPNTITITCSLPNNHNPKAPLFCSSNRSLSNFRHKNAGFRPNAYSSASGNVMDYSCKLRVFGRTSNQGEIPVFTDPSWLLFLTLVTRNWEKVFAIIGVKVYAAGLYANPSIFSKLDAWRGHSSAELQKDSSLFVAIYQAPLEKSLHIILVRDLDGKTFWDALDEALSPRITSPTPIDKFALSTFQGIFQGRPLQKGTSIFLTWLNTEKMLVFVTPEGIPSSIDATIESPNVSSALFDVFLGGNPVSPSLKASSCNGLAAALK